MRRVINKLRFCAVALLAFVFLWPADHGAQANDLSDFNLAVSAAYAPYRGAVSYLRTGNAGLAALELEAAAENWRKLEARFAKTPPDAFADDPAWQATLKGISERLDQGLVAMDAGDMETATKLLSPVRGQLGELRRRNNIVVFSDRVDEMTHAMERLWRFRHKPPDFAVAEELQELRSSAAVLGYLFRRCSQEAPAELRENTSFLRLSEGAALAVDRLWRAIDERDQRLLINTLRELRSFERLMFLQFG